MNWLQFQNKPALFTVLIFCDGFETALSKKINYLAYGAEGVLTVDEANLKDGVLSRDLPEEPLLWPRMGV